MSFVDQSIESIDESFLESLLENKVSEAKTVDYKAAPPGADDKAHVEFLSDVSSFANASGGYLFYGIREASGVPVEICVVSDVDPDGQILRMENMIRDGVDPRVPGVAIQAIPLRSGAHVFTIRIPKSWASPHAVRFKKHWRFYSRNSAGKYPLDVSELRAAFAVSESAAERIRRFRIERLAALVASETPIPLDGKTIIAVHLVPVSAFSGSISIQMPSSTSDLSLLHTLTGGFYTWRYNLDGILTYAAPNDLGQVRLYVQAFRNGCIESVDTHILKDTSSHIPSIQFEAAILGAIPRYLSFQKSLGVLPPTFVMLTLLGVRDYVMARRRKGPEPPRITGPEQHRIDRDTLLIPEILIENAEADIGVAMKPCFDAVWNAAGLPQSENYGPDGRWRGR